MAPVDTSRARLLHRVEDFDTWLAEHGAKESDFVAAIYKKPTGKQTVTFEELLDVALCHGWVDVKTKRIDDETYAIQFVPRRVGSNWSRTNRDRARRLVREGRMRPTGAALLPDDLDTEVGDSPGT